MKRRKLSRDERRRRRVARFVHLEKALVAEWIAQGYADAKERAAQAREILRYGVDWFYAQHKQPAYSESGAQKLWLAMVTLGKPMGESHNGSEGMTLPGQHLAGPTSAERETVTNADNAQANRGAGDFTVEKLVLNPTTLFARDSNGKLQTVIVGRAENFTVGMKLAAIPHPNYSGFYLLKGPLPRFKGRY